MKIKFENNLDYQNEAIDSLCNLFDGQKQCTTTFTVPTAKNQDLFSVNEGVANRLELDQDELLENLRSVQLNNGLKQSQSLASKDFTVEMETGTGKTYVYLKSIFELNQKYGFSKFIIVVPSIAIKEGTIKSLEITKEHFKEQFDNVRYDFFHYDSQKLEQVRSFATNDYIQIMVINIGAFNKSFKDPSKEDKANIIHRRSEKLSGRKPIELIAQTSPILIIDEPQTVDTTEKSAEAIASLNPLCSFRFSATHREKHHPIFKLDAIDAYNKNLVKEISVASFVSEDDANRPYIRLLKVDNKKSPITAQVEIDANVKGVTKRKKISVKQNVDLAEKAKRSIYSGYIIKDIYCGEDQQYIDFTGREDVVHVGQAINTVDEDLIKRQQIQKTIEEHLDKELLLNPKAIKVLSLFFIDKVSNYRGYDAEGHPVKGKYALWFEEIYQQVASRDKYRTLFGEVKDIDVIASEAHNGYFAQDKKGGFKDTKGTTSADEDVYQLIMKDKEKLLSFDSKLRFIFSHSALREGWDNPNVFQICTLNETTSEIKKRQEIGRGLRLAVNQFGERVKDRSVNQLTVMANVSYKEFSEKLQKELEEDLGIKFGVIEIHSFAGIKMPDPNNTREYKPIGEEQSNVIREAFMAEGYIDKKGKVTDTLRIALRDNKLVVPAEFAPIKPQIEQVTKKITGSLNIKNVKDKKTVQVRKEVLLSEEFKALWDKIKYKTKYRLSFNTATLIDHCAKALKENMYVGNAKVDVITNKMGINKSGVESVSEKTRTMEVQTNTALPDILTYIQNETQLTRRTLAKILTQSDTLEHFKRNPQKYIDEAIRMIKDQMAHLLIDGVEYEKLGETEFYGQRLFEDHELIGYLDSNLTASSKSPYDHVLYDSGTERDFVTQMEKQENVKLYAKLPSWFKIDTPVGTYNPDWAIVWEKDGDQKLFFVVETKGGISELGLRPTEKAKIDCGKKHFKALGTGAELQVVSSLSELRK